MENNITNSTEVEIFRQPVFKYNQLASCQNIHSEYKGNLTIAPAGNIQDYITGLKDLVVPYPKLMLVYIAGASGMIKQALNIADTNIMVNIYGDSSSGKTTASDLAFSFWGKFSSIGFNTINRTEQMLVNRFIIPTAVDDLLGINICSSNREQMKTIMDQIFRYSAGKGKGRMNQDGAEYHGTVISSSETSLFKKIMGTEADGQFYRMIEMHIRRGELTTDANHAKQINSLIRKNYGLGAPELGRFMVQNGYIGDKLMDLYEEQCNVIANDSRLSKYARIANRLGIIMVTCDLLDKCFGLGINKAAIQETLIACVTQSFTVMKKRVARWPNRSAPR